MLKWSDFNQYMKNTDPDYSNRNRGTRLQMYQNYTKEWKLEPMYIETGISEERFSLAQLKIAVPVKGSYKCKHLSVIQEEEGNNPMRYNDNYASASVTSAPSDTAVARQHLLNRLEKAEWPKQNELPPLFNLNVDNTPKTYKDLIDAIKGGKYTIDEKIAKKVDAYDPDEDDYVNYNGPFWGIIWDGPKSDHNGYSKAVTEMRKQITATKDIIMTADAATGLKALQDFEAWLPEVGTTAN